MNNELKSIPHFNNEEEEQNFWATHDSTEYIDWGQVVQHFTFPNLKRSTDDENT